MTGLAAGAILVAMVIGVADGDTIALQGGTRVRLEGIAAPELKEPFGGQSSDALRRAALGQEATCVAAGTPQSHGREVMRCSVNGVDLGLAMVMFGHARVCWVRGKRPYEQALDRLGAVPATLPGYCK